MAIERRRHRARRAGRRQAPHRALAQRPGRDRRGAVRPRQRRSRARRRHARSCAALVDAAERHLDWPLPGYTHLQRGQPVYLVPPPARLRLDARARPRAVRASPTRQADRAAARRRRAGGRELRHRPPRGRGASSASPAASRRTRSTRSPTATSSSTSCSAAATCLTHLARLGSELVHLVERRSSASSCCPTRGRAARRSCRRRRTPTRPSCCGPRRRASSGTSTALYGVLHALPLTYNKDMQEDKEHLFDAVDTLELCLAAADGHGRRRALRPRADGRRGVRRAHRRDRPRRPARQARHAVPRGPRRRRRPRAPGGRGPARSFRDARRAPSSATRRPRCCARRRGWSRRSPRAGRRWRACASSSSRRARCWGERRGPRVLRPARARGRRRPRRLHAALRRRRRASSSRPRPTTTAEAACHAYVGLTARTEVLCGPPGIAYVYRSYGIHALFNAVCEPDGVGAAVLIRALEPTDGIEVMRCAAGPSPTRELCNGPGKLTQALGIDARPQPAPTWPAARADRDRAAGRRLGAGRRPAQRAAHRHHQGRRPGLALHRPGPPGRVAPAPYGSLISIRSPCSRTSYAGWATVAGPRTTPPSDSPNRAAVAAAFDVAVGDRRRSLTASSRGASSGRAARARARPGGRARPASRRRSTVRACPSGSCGAVERGRPLRRALVERGLVDADALRVGEVAADEPAGASARPRPPARAARRARAGPCRGRA